MINYKKYDGITIAVVSGAVINTKQDMLDLIAQVSYEGCGSIIIHKEMLPEEFFSLKTGIAGEMLQKFSNYRMKLAIIGDFDNVKSRSLHDFIYECNKGRQVFFKKTEQEAQAALAQAL